MNINLSLYDFCYLEWLPKLLREIEHNQPIIIDECSRFFRPSYIIQDSKLLLTKVECNNCSSFVQSEVLKLKLPLHCDWVTGSFLLDYGEFRVIRCGVIDYRCYQKQKLLTINTGVITVFTENTPQNRLFSILKDECEVFKNLTIAQEEKVLAVVNFIKKDTELIQQLLATDNIDYHDTAYPLALLQATANVFGNSSIEIQNLLNIEGCLKSYESTLYKYLKEKI